MRLESQVCSLELAKRLKELGVKQESLFYWHHENGKDYVSYADPSFCLCPYEKISAFTVAELGELLPAGMLSSRAKDNTGWYIQVITPVDKWNIMYACETEADARAKMLIYLSGNNLWNNKNDRA